MYLKYLDSEERKYFLELAQLIAQSNGFIDEKEEAMLEYFRDEMSLSHSEYELKQMSLDDILQYELDEKTKRIFFLEGLAIAFADGIYHKEQEEIIVRLKKKYGFSQELYEQFKEKIITINKVYGEVDSLIHG